MFHAQLSINQFNIMIPFFSFTWDELEHLEVEFWWEIVPKLLHIFEDGWEQTQCRSCGLQSKQLLRQDSNNNWDLSHISDTQSMAVPQFYLYKALNI